MGGVTILFCFGGSFRVKLVQFDRCDQFSDHLRCLYLHAGNQVPVYVQCNVMNGFA